MTTSTRANAAAFDDLVFAEATPLQRLLCWRSNAESWASPLTVDQYVERETVLSQTLLFANGNCRYWVVHRQDDPEDIVSSCESTKRTVLIADKHGSRKANAYAIASVYTNPAYRGRGMASFMLRKLQDFMDGESECSVLYSDIGKTYYAGLGWALYPSLQVTLCLDATSDRTSFTAPNGIKYLSREDIRPLCEKDVAAVTDGFNGLGQDGKTHVIFIPTIELIDQHFARDGFISEKLLNRQVQHCGAITEDGKCWVYWYRDLREKKLKIQRIVTAYSDDKVADTAKLLQAALEEAANWGLEKVSVWNPNDVASAAAKAVAAGGLKVVFEERDSSLPSLRWKDGEDLAIVWEENEYYSWC